MAPVTRLERDSTLPLGTATVQRLERLAGTLEERGMCVTLVAPPSRVPRLQVAHPAPDGATGDIYASRGRDGNWWFWWPWAERIGAEGNLEAAAVAIEQALTRPARGGRRAGPRTHACGLARVGMRQRVSGARGPGRRRGL